MKIPCYLQLEPNSYSGGRVVGAKAAAVTQRYPDNAPGRRAIVKVVLDIEPSAFDAIATAEIKIPDSHVALSIEAEPAED